MTSNFSEYVKPEAAEEKIFFKSCWIDEKKTWEYTSRTSLDFDHYICLDSKFTTGLFLCWSHDVKRAELLSTRILHD